jgi:hypothetical protein
MPLPSPSQIEGLKRIRCSPNARSAKSWYLSSMCAGGASTLTLRPRGSGGGVSPRPVSEARTGAPPGRTVPSGRNLPRHAQRDVDGERQRPRRHFTERRPASRGPVRPPVEPEPTRHDFSRWYIAATVSERPSRAHEETERSPAVPVVNRRLVRLRGGLHKSLTWPVHPWRILAHAVDDPRLTT